MNTVNPAVRLRGPDESSQPGRNLRQWWTSITILLAATFFMEAVFAGAMLSGLGWARKAHAASAMMLIASTLVAGLAALVGLRRIPHGLRLGSTLLSLAAVALLQAAVGALSAKGANLTWIHVPLGVALVGLAGLAVTAARRLGGP
ncbi:MAG TPA: hypothetical protein VFE13_15435 [Caulobacteraceae bacterium]|nr:hypothetical protein [Caulobacteraceae bacterium]